MEVVILCGGKGIRLVPKTMHVPKPMLNIGDMPILEHIIRFFSKYGHNDFILCLGYKGAVIKGYFKDKKEWNIKFLDTGENSSKGDRLRIAKGVIKGGKFFVAYGDDLSDVNLNSVIDFHNSHNGIATLTATRLKSPFGIINFDESRKVLDFEEKPILDHYINGGFFVFDKKIFDFLEEGEDIEKDLFPKLSKKDLVYAYKHDGFWACMNTHQDNVTLNELWNKKEAKWKVW
ncbi:MAG: glucose-1-phosphate cytidylyltransferase [Candidatus Aenigmarchaeota archaeon]|nr:glucose-1-phosphate cytidylyltransferase [Candidatus Aenigmarchaeota archaeon]